MNSVAWNHEKCVLKHHNFPLLEPQDAKLNYKLFPQHVFRGPPLRKQKKLLSLSWFAMCLLMQRRNNKHTMDGWMNIYIWKGRLSCTSPAAACVCVSDAEHKMHLAWASGKEREKVLGMRVTISWIRHALFSSAAGAWAEGGINKYIHTLPMLTHIHTRISKLVPTASKSHYRGALLENPQHI